MSDMQAIPYWHVDAFAEAPYTGNQAAVVVVDRWPSDDIMRAVAAENMFAETAFLIETPGGDIDYKLRWFTPTLEVALCGHATLASGHAILSGDERRERVTFSTRQAGTLEVRRAGDLYELALPAIPTTREPFDEAVALLGAEPLEVWRNPGRYNIFLYEDAAAIRALDPDLRGLAKLGDHQFICTAPGDPGSGAGAGTDVITRNFVPGGGVDEDSFTGSAHAVLTPFWCERLGRNSFTAFQASERGGHATCRLDGDRAILGGGCVTIAEGRFYLTG
ncbi:PhzF family phenazine biosynthesis protein [Aurantiacibacter aquimixticola]|uniref:PhzF family phenazine biosynthesis protein n=1 Tax=Aurantiacibacter aquimixticola TaxID=1958945 RepID=A0A419RV05_9SPHN|nr:PhzF family phenazine biosynthesis protein [Aurantiacibacter aquimixticola]RJY09615.1 PhzF family phenazine biosynthesis protein [Aurantiacibacter aquimixticola]